MSVLARIVEAHKKRVKKVYNSTNSCGLISLVNTLFSSDQFLSLLDIFTARPGTGREDGGVLGALRR